MPIHLLPKGLQSELSRVEGAPNASKSGTKWRVFGGIRASVHWCKRREEARHQQPWFVVCKSPSSLISAPFINSPSLEETLIVIMRASATTETISGFFDGLRKGCGRVPSSTCWLKCIPAGLRRPYLYDST